MRACLCFCSFVLTQESPFLRDLLQLSLVPLFLMQGIEPGPSDTLSTHSATELHPNPVFPFGLALASLAHLGPLTSHQWMPALGWAVQSMPYLM